MPHESPRPCPVCGSLRKRSIKLHSAHHLARCIDCDMVHVAVEPTSDELHAYYGDYPVHSDVSPITLKRYDELLQRFERYRAHGRILDVGCGAGNFLERAIRAGWEAHGTEYGTNALATCRSKGINILEGELNPANYPEGHFDVVCSFEVIEHVTHPARELERMTRIARPGGLLYITTPNYNGLGRLLAREQWSVVNYPEHLNYFTPRTLKRIAKEHGLRSAWMKTTGVDLIRLRVRRSMATPQRQTVRNNQEDLRQQLETKPVLRFAKSLLNGVLTLLGRGDHMKAAFTRRLQ
jgi:2-polyprenyl-3-methyl-5-hydroxy-6-metoxy-1,4-benzoquinol methylase